MKRMIHENGVIRFAQVETQEEQARKEAIVLLRRLHQGETLSSSEQEQALRFMSAVILDFLAESPR